MRARKEGKWGDREEQGGTIYLKKQYETTQRRQKGRQKGTREEQ